MYRTHERERRSHQHRSIQPELKRDRYDVYVDMSSYVRFIWNRHIVIVFD